MRCRAVTVVSGYANIGASEVVTAETTFRIGSITKLWTAIAAALLHACKTVDLDRDVRSYLRDVQLRGNVVTSRHLLTHTADLRFRQAPALVDLASGTPFRELAERGVNVVGSPGARWLYSNVGFTVLGEVLAEAAGAAFRDVLLERVFPIFAATESDLVVSERVGERPAVGYVRLGSSALLCPQRLPQFYDWPASTGRSSISDLARLGEWLVRELRGQDDWVALLAKPSMTLSPGALTGAPGKVSQRHGLFSYVESDSSFFFIRDRNPDLRVVWRSSQSTVSASCFVQMVGSPIAFSSCDSS